MPITMGVIVAARFKLGSRPKGMRTVIDEFGTRAVIRIGQIVKAASMPVPATVIRSPILKSPVVVTENVVAPTTPVVLALAEIVGSVPVPSGFSAVP